MQLLIHQVMRIVCQSTLALAHMRCACADRVFGILRENNPELTGEKRRTIMKPPQVLLQLSISIMQSTVMIVIGGCPG